MATHTSYIAEVRVSQLRGSRVLLRSEYGAGPLSDAVVKAGEQLRWFRRQRLAVSFRVRCSDGRVVCRHTAGAFGRSRMRQAAW